jgi:hypothetical protein
VVVNFPAIAEYYEGWRAEGEALWPERFSLETLARIREAVGTGWFDQRNTLNQSHRPRVQSRGKLLDGSLRGVPRRLGFASSRCCAHERVPIILLWKDSYDFH